VVNSGHLGGRSQARFYELLARVGNVIAYLAFADANNAGPNIPYGGLLVAFSGASLLLAACTVLSAIWA
jgi:hypothetical protein